MLGLTVPIGRVEKLLVQSEYEVRSVTKNGASEYSSEMITVAYLVAPGAERTTL
jgi:hypothetical protein